MKPIIELNSINKTYSVGEEKLQVLKDVSLTVNEGEFLSILGPSGSGKSTLMNIIGCMDSWDTGTYSLDGADISSCDDNALSAIRNEKIGFIFQKYHLIPKYTVLQNVMMPLLIRGMPWSEAAQAAACQLEHVGLSNRAAHKPKELSGGQQQRVAIARALITSPAVLLADEPTGASDSATGQEVLALFEGLNKQGNTIVMITHDLSVAKKAQRMVNIIDGVLSQ